MIFFFLCPPGRREPNNSKSYEWILMKLKAQILLNACSAWLMQNKSNLQHSRRSNPHGAWSSSMFCSAPVCVWQRRSVKAVGNRNTMAAALSLTQVTLSYNSNITTTHAVCPLSVLLEHISGLLSGTRQAEKSSQLGLCLSFFKFTSAVTGKSFCPSLRGLRKGVASLLAC